MGTLRFADLKLAALTSILVLAAYIGVVDGFNAGHWARNFTENVTAAAQFICGTLAFIALMAVLKRHRSARQLIEFWGAIFVATAIMSPVVFDDAPLAKALLSGVGASLLVVINIWLWAGNRIPIALPVAKQKPVVIQQVISPVDRWDRELADLKARMSRAEA